MPVQQGRVEKVKKGTVTKKEELLRWVDIRERKDMTQLLPSNKSMSKKKITEIQSLAREDSKRFAEDYYGKNVAVELVRNRTFWELLRRYLESKMEELVQRED